MPPETLTRIDLPGREKLRSGKVRDIYDLGDRLLFVASDRISAFDCILPTGIPWKGHVLNQLSAWWFNRLAAVARHHVIETDVDRFPQELRPYRRQLAGRSMIVKKTEVLPIECVARGYLIGGGWKEYQETGAISGQRIPPGLALAGRLEEPIFTPARKAETGHDENIAFEQVVHLVGLSTAKRLRELTLALYREAAAYALQRGLIIADTKFEFGMLDGEILLIDEALTPDSSRFWPADQYAPGRSPPSFDKQFVRDYLESLTWDKRPPAPPLPAEVAARTSEKYVEAFRRLTGRELAG